MIRCRPLLPSRCPRGRTGAGGRGQPGADRRAIGAGFTPSGMAAGDPLLILTAARLRKHAPALAGRGGRCRSAGKRCWPGAEALAAGDAGLLALIDDVRAETTKGVASGPVYTIADVQAGRHRNASEIQFRRRRLCRGLCRGAAGRQPEPDHPRRGRAPGLRRHRPLSPSPIAAGPRPTTGSFPLTRSSNRGPGRRRLRADDKLMDAMLRRSPSDHRLSPSGPACRGARELRPADRREPVPEPGGTLVAEGPGATTWQLVATYLTTEAPVPFAAENVTVLTDGVDGRTGRRPWRRSGRPSPS